MLMMQPGVLQEKKTLGNSRKLTWTLHCPIPCHFLPDQLIAPRGRQGEDVQTQTQGESKEQKEDGRVGVKIILQEAKCH